MGSLAPKRRRFWSAHTSHRGVESFDFRSRLAMLGSIRVLIAPFGPWFSAQRLKTPRFSSRLWIPFRAKKLSRKYISPAAEYQMLGASMGRGVSGLAAQQSIIAS